MFFSGKRPSNLGDQDGKLAPCPARPNCVSSHCEEGLHHIAPLLFELDPIEEMKRLSDLLEKMSRVDIIESRDNYVYAECRSRLMGFVDDLEFYWDPDEGVCHVRSASRLGISDIGQNRRRVEIIRSTFENELRNQRRIDMD